MKVQLSERVKKQHEKESKKHQDQKQKTMTRKTTISEVE